MKVRIIATGEIVEVYESCNEDFPWTDEMGDKVWKTEELIFLETTEKHPDYWEKLLHQYAGMAMQGMIKTYEQMMRADIECKMDCCEYVDAKVANGVLRSHAEACAEFCAEFATALVEKLKEESNG